MSSNLPISSPYRSKPEAPVTDSERDQLTSRLNGAFTAGTLSQDDYQVRLDQLFAARRLGELVPVVEGLPPLQTYNDPANITSGGQPGELAEARPGGRLALMLVGGLALLLALIAILVVLIL